MRTLKLLRIPFIVLGFLLPLFIVSLITALALGEKEMLCAFLVPIFFTLAVSIPSILAIRKKPPNLRSRDSFLLVSLSWFFMGFLGALPYYLSGSGISFTDAFFESSCGFATTGATTIFNVEVLPKSLLLWRSLSHWAGGMGIIVLTVALLPLLGVGGFQLIKAEAPGPEKERVTPKITATAKVLWAVYFILTLILFFLYRIGGMDVFDAACHAFTCLATGGVSTKNSGLAYFNSIFIDIVTTIFMMIAAFNFILYFRLLKGKFKDVICNTEGRAYFLIFIFTCTVITFTLVPYYGSISSALRYASFQTASILSTTGSAAADYELWPPLAKAAIFFLMFIGGCSGSTAGGVKVIRYAVLWKQAGNEIKRLIYPRGIFSVRLNSKPGRKDVVYGVAGFIFLYFSVVAISTLITAASGIDLLTAFSASLSVTGNIGTGFGGIGPAHNYGFFPDHIKWFFSFIMIASRLELWTVFVLFTRDYWRL
ncbi:Trk system potassium transporter TrkH [Spirochaetia bacterium]|nr:Trk system potassium transporter TrkH [Spirochaetia bacterium]